MRHVHSTPFTIAATSLCVFWFLALCPAGALAPERLGRAATAPGRTYALAFSAFELAKIFGRLADQSPIGSVLAAPTSRIVGVCTRGRRKWREIFVEEGEEIDRAQFVSRLSATGLTWPTYYVANRQPPFLVPEKQRHKFRLKGYLANVAGDLHKTDDLKGAESADVGRMLREVAVQPLDHDAAETVFMTLSHEENKLTVNHILAFIKYRSPLLQMVNWEAFLASLPVGPEDILI
ncbi:uncharacterized protein BXIN_0845 [Babesia sp. Xinjiang]|uniref:uncharacterized protein n=1 Tax=Babesia sp. Xinjiang TaxID=462227 RepID=UPI000A24C049|nr:uncharacterized protein BXIN_0845 [Babesia sp. Xinjiang]ORM41262.1 hypothetical protein BXIN_0845 [Babesia sp. Xinjiang]